MVLQKIIVIKAVIYYILLIRCDTNALDLSDDLSTIEPEASIGCPAPDLRFTRPKATEPPIEISYAESGTTQIYLSEDLATSDIEIIEKVDDDINEDNFNQDKIIMNRYQIESDITESADIQGIEDNYNQENQHQKNRNAGNKKRRFTGGRRRRVENKNNQRFGYERYKRYATEVIFDNIKIYPAFSKNMTQISFIDKENNTKIVNIHKYKLHKKSKTNKKKQKKHKINEINGNFTLLKDSNVTNITDSRLLELNNKDFQDKLDNEFLEKNLTADDKLQRVKRKSGKTTGALSRPKGGGDSGSKTTSRKDKGGYDEEGGYSPVHPEEESSEEIDKESESSEHSHFTEVSEIRFPGEVGPLGDRRLCKIRCIKGKWVGPLCATNEEDDHGNVKFQPLYKSCRVQRIPPHLLLSYRNISVNLGWDLPHGHSLQARCKDLGLYKLLGEPRVLCSNGVWMPRMPSCVPTTLLTNFSDDSPPSIRIKIGSGSGAFEPSGVLAVLPGSIIHLDCMYPRRRGTPEWTWTGWFKQYYTGWSTVPEEKATKYRLTIKDIQNQDSGTFTCASPRGLTNSIPIVVTTSECSVLSEPAAPLSLRLEGNKLGQKALYHCPLGYSIEGIANSTCLASGNWSSPPPTCYPVQCPPLLLEDPHLSLTELNTSAWGRAVFKCSWGFRLSGPPGLECEPSGVWSGPVPRCRAIQCPQPLVPINGRIDGTSGSSSHRRYAVGALVTFSCTEGHLLVGEASIVCTETGFWSHPPPFCKSQCSYPGDPPNGLIAPLKFQYDPGDLLSVQCRPGFVEYNSSGPQRRPRCLPDGNWSGPVPQCRSYEEV